MYCLCLVGLNHKTAPIAIREQFFMTPVERELLLAELKNDPQVLEVFVLSTCHRIEIYAHLLNNNPEILLSVLCKVKKTNLKTSIREHFYVKQAHHMINHLFDVACGLDSLVVGEKQILGQVKDAAQLSRKAGILGKVFNILLNIVLNTGKTAQSKTCISQGGSSVSWAAVTSAQKILGTLENKKILIVGAGKMSQLTAGQLVKKSVGHVYVMNRTYANAQVLAKTTGAQVAMFWDLKNILVEVDVCICSSGASYFLVEQALIAEVMVLRKGKPLLLVDISTPRNIDPLTAQVYGVRLVSIDDLDVLIEENLQSRQSAVKQVQQIILRKKDFFYRSIDKCEHQHDFAYVKQ